MPRASPNDAAGAASAGATRLAPSPTGALHLGNARTFLLNWLLARQRGWRIHLRIEDLDGPRVRRGADLQAIEDLRWLGLDWDAGPTYQGGRGTAYRAAVDRLIAAGRAYPCICTRREVELAASAPHAEDGAAVYPGTCRGRFGSIAEAAAAAGGRAPAVRFQVDDGAFAFADDFAGERRWERPGEQLGDFVIQKSDGTAAYQLAVVVDDAEAGVTHVVRGDDLIDSTPRQIMLYHALGMGAAVPQYLHLPLVVGEDGRRLAKRHGDTRLATYREAGVPAGRVRALLARWSGVEAGDGGDCSFEALLSAFRLDRVPRLPVTFTAADDAWLRGGGRPR